jgi:hypothetical protein
VRTFETVADQLLRTLCVGDASVELCDLSLSQASPVSMSRAKLGEKLFYLREREPRVLAETNERDAFRARLRVASPLTDTLGG